MTKKVMNKKHRGKRQGNKNPHGEKITNKKIIPFPFPGTIKPCHSRMLQAHHNWQ
jgi:hypothetical protein